MKNVTTGGTTLIYSLNDPTTGLPRYVGKTKKATDRLWQHVTDSKRKTCPKHTWIQGLLDTGLYPQMEIIDEVPDSEWRFWETQYVRLYFALGFRLTNLGGSGQGVTEHTEDTKRKISATSSGRKCSEEAKRNMRLAQQKRGPVSDETRLKMSISRRARTDVLSAEARARIAAVARGNKYGLGRIQSPEEIAWRRKVMKGKQYALGYKHTDETKRRISEKNKKMIFTMEHRRKISEANTGRSRMTDIGKEKMRIFRTGRKASEETKIKMRESRRIIREKTESLCPNHNAS